MYLDSFVDFGAVQIVCLFVYLPFFLTFSFLLASFLTYLVPSLFTF